MEHGEGGPGCPGAPAPSGSSGCRRVFCRAASAPGDHRAHVVHLLGDLDAVACPAHSRCHRPDAFAPQAPFVSRCEPEAFLFPCPARCHLRPHRPSLLARRALPSTSTGLWGLCSQKHFCPHQTCSFYKSNLCSLENLRRPPPPPTGDQSPLWGSPPRRLKDTQETQIPKPSEGCRLLISPGLCRQTLPPSSPLRITGLWLVGIFMI